MNVHLERAQLLLQQSRASDAERELMLAIGQSPDQPLPHAYLALCRTDLGRAKEALPEAQAAVGLAPDGAFFHYVVGVVFHRLDRQKDARAAVSEAIRLDPEAEVHFALLASIHLAERDWQGAVDAAEQGLALNPEDVQCANLRSMALVRLGRKEEAMATVDQALAREPDNALSHANQRWNCLHRNDPHRAQEHFREALRLNPDLEYARQGMLEALKARNPVYRGMLAYFLWMSRQSGRLQWTFVIGTYFVIRFARSAAESSPGWGWVLWPVVVAFYAFVYLSWTATPMFNLLLRFDRFGRMVLSKEERVASNWFGAAFGVALACLIAWGSGAGELALFGTISGAMLSVCAAVTFNRVGKKKILFASVSGLLALIAVAGFALALTGHPVGLDFLLLFFGGFIGFQLLANFVPR